MSYQYDIFISYRRDPLTYRWIEEQFLPLLRHCVQLELSRPPVVFIDTSLEVGTTWPISLGSALGASRTIIPLWTKTFLKSVWCSCEIGNMVERESRMGYRTIEKPGGLIFPTVIHDGETMPVQLSTIQKIEIQDCYNVRMSVNSPKAEILADKLKALGKSIADAIEAAPDWQAEWGITAVNSFVNQYHTSTAPQQTSAPKFSNL